MSLRMRKRYLMGMKGLMTLPLDRCSDMCVDLWHSGINPSNPTPEIQEQGAT